MTNKPAQCTMFNAGKGFYINICIMLALMIFFRFIPAFGSMTENGMAVLGVFLGTIYGWTTLKDMPLASACGILMMGTTGIFASPIASVQAAFSHNLFISVVGCFALVSVMSHSGMIEYMVKAILGSRFARKSIPGLLIAITIFSYLFGFFGNFGMYALVWVLWKGIVDEIGGDKKLLEFGIALTSIGFVMCANAWQFTPPVLAVESMFAGVTGLETAGIVPYSLWMFITTMLVTLLFLLAGKFLFKVQFPKDYTVSETKQEKMTAYQVVTLVLFILYLGILVLSNIFKFPVLKFLGSFNIVGLGVAALIICLILRPAGSFDLINHALNSSIQWGMLLNMGIVGLFILTLGSEDVGISATIASCCGFLSELPPVAFMIVVTVVPLFLTQFLNNMALGTVLIPVVCTMAMNLGLNTTAIFYTLVITTGLTLATPSGSANSAFMFSWSDIERKSCFKYGWTIFGIGVVVCLIMLLGLGNLFFPM